MIQTKGTGISSEQLEILRKCFYENQSLYNTELKAEKNEFKRIATLASTLPIILIIMFLVDAYMNGTSIGNILGLLAILITLLFLFFMIWGATRNPNMPYRNQKGLIKMLEECKSLCIKGSLKSSNKSNFYSLATKKSILNGIPNNIKIDTQDNEVLILESSNIYTITGSQNSQIIDDCMLSKVTYKSKGILSSFSIQKDTTNNIVMILRQLLSSILWGFVVCSVYYIFIAEKCDYNSLDGGCDNKIDLMGLFSSAYMTYTFIIGFVFFAFGYLKTLIRKDRGNKISSGNDFDIFLHKGKISDIPPGYLEEIKIFFKKHSTISNNCTLFTDENYLYIHIDRDLVSYNNNFVVFLYNAVVRGMSKNGTERDYVKKYVNYINFINSVHTLGDKLKVYYR